MKRNETRRERIFFSHDQQGANRASDMAKKAAIIAIILGIVWSIATGYEVNTLENVDDDDDSRP